MRNRHLLARFFVILLVLVQAQLACNLPGGLVVAAPTVDQTAVAFQVQQTIQAIVPSPTSTTAPADTQLPPTQAPQDTQAVPPTDTLVPLPTEVLPTITPIPTSGPPTITSSVDTNCRYGPNTVYKVLGYLLVGQQSTVFGRLSDNSWWYIENPKKPGQYCWVWGETTTVVGDVNSLPVLTPPPTPTPSLTVALKFSNFHLCGGILTAILQVTNNGSDFIKSISLTIKTVSGNIILYGPAVTNAPFAGGSGMCPPGGNNLAPGDTGYIGGQVGPLVSGAVLQANLVACADKNLNGICVDTSVKFTVP